MEDFIKRGKSEKVNAKAGKNFQRRRGIFLAGKNIYPCNIAKVLLLISKFVVPV